jgi:hypothetical protein
VPLPQATFRVAIADREGMAKLEGPAFIAIKTGISEQLPGGRVVGMLAPGLPREAMSVAVVTTMTPK